MKALKVLLIALVAIFTLGTAQAQIVVKAHIGDHHRRVYHHHYRHHHYYHHR